MAAPKGFLIVPVGFRADGTLRALELTDSDELKVALSTATGSDLLTELQAKLETADLELVSKILSTGSHGWVGGALQKQPILLGYSDRVRDDFTGTSTGAGSTDALSTAVPAGEIHIVNFISCYHTDPVARSISIYAYDGSGSYILATYSSVGQYATNISTTMFILKEDDQIQVKCWSLANTKEIKAAFWGYRIDIDQ